MSGAIPVGTARYEEDLVRWSEEQASALRAAAAAGANLPLDWENIAEEIDSLGRSTRSELRNRAANVTEHLSKLVTSPTDEPRRGWVVTIQRERVAIQELFDENPSLVAERDELAKASLIRGRKLSMIGLGEYEELSSQRRRRLAALDVSADQIFGDWLPDDVA